MYRVEFVDHGDNVRGVERIERASDAEAIEAAHKMNVPTFIAGFDVWEEDRLVHRHRKYQRSRVNLGTAPSGGSKSAGCRSW
jgi:hypothetical protein